MSENLLIQNTDIIEASLSDGVRTTININYKIIEEIESLRIKDYLTRSKWIQIAILEKIHRDKNRDKIL